MIKDAMSYPFRGSGRKRFLALAGSAVGLFVAMGVVIFLTLFGTVMTIVRSAQSGQPMAGVSALLGGAGVAATAVILFGVVAFTVVIQGYYVRVLRSTVQGDDEMPPLSRLGRLLLDGVAATVLYVLYSLLVLVPLVVSTVYELRELSIVIVVLAVSTYYALPAGLAAYAAGGFAWAFFPSRVVPIAVTKDYLLAWVLSLLLVVFLSVIAALSNLIPVVGTLFSLAVFVYLGLVAHRLYGRAATDLSRVA